MLWHGAKKTGKQTRGHSLPESYAGKERKLPAGLLSVFECYTLTPSFTSGLYAWGKGGFCDRAAPGFRVSNTNETNKTNLIE